MLFQAILNYTWSKFRKSQAPSYYANIKACPEAVEIYKEL
jgi:hypothetical protein